MTPEQKRLSRHALGLPNDRMQSYRNRYHISMGIAFFDWKSMEDSGLAYHHSKGGSFHLTRKGAELALETGESLCKEDFPDAD